MRIQGNTTAGKLLDSSKASLLNNLKIGDVLQGTVKQLYPNHKAAIQMQGNQLIAQLEASLSVGGKYFFQVTSSEGKVPELKVMTGEQQNGKQLIGNLLQQLGIKETRLSSQLVSMLVREQIPMQRRDLLQAVQYIQDNKISAQQAQPVLMQLMKLRIPVTAASFQAMQAYQTGDLGESLAVLQRSLPPGQQPMLQANLEHILKGFASEESAVRAILTADIQQDKPVLFPLLQRLGLVSKALDKQGWTGVLQQLGQAVSQNQTGAAPFTVSLEGMKEQIKSILANQQQLIMEAVAAQGGSVPAQDRPNLAAQFPQYFSNHAQENQGAVRQVVEVLSEPKNYQVLERLMNILEFSNEKALKIVLTADAKQANPALFPLLQNLGFVPKALDKQGWANTLQQWNPPGAQNPGTVTPPFTTSVEGVREQLQSILGNKMQLMTEARVLYGAMMQGTSFSEHPKANLAAQFPQYFSNPAQVTQGNEGAIRPLLESLAEAKSYQAIERLMNIWTASSENVNNNPKEQFLHQIQWVLRDAGVNAESSLKTDEANSMQMKHLLLEMLQNNSGGTGRENAQQVLHFLNGMQLNNIHDSSYFVQVNIQIPSQKLGLSKDIDLHFEGKKTSDGNIDPEYCRIIFDLQLQSMKETIIDIHVQKKALSITVYNDQSTTPVLIDTFRPNLQEALEQINYQVASIVCKPYTEADKQQRQTGRIADEKAGQGKVDFRV
ncbi:hypothetical protein [Oceanobacillus neutriphilus]|uniref:Flagellar hook-length control protein FliK n=1 Tax=Oceanobacillus neutriphilus TaxID=531815 RepID=A0ABQ2NWH2_9BACI|nr:hypothetical protein [Oceanobacillus neutriphilus]GGP12333.1 hypothetical protein GCM10011346_27880 [Oceanobacillus neutriphilus]